MYTSRYVYIIYIFNVPLDHCIYRYYIYIYIYIYSQYLFVYLDVLCCPNIIVRCLVPGMLISVLFIDVPVAAILYMATTVMFPLALLSLLKAKARISRVSLSRAE